MALAASGLAAAGQSSWVFSITQSGRYFTNPLDGVNWRTRVARGETGWPDASPALLDIEGAALPALKYTPPPERPGGGPRRTYYFRTTCGAANAPCATALTFSNLIDDGAIFHLNGAEIRRAGMDNTNSACSSLAGRTVSDAATSGIFSITGNLLTNLVTGDNVLAVEVHQVTPTSTDIVFGTAVIASTTVSVTRGPYLQSGSHSNVTVRWRTDAGVNGRVRFGTNQANLDPFADEDARPNDHEVTLT